ASGTGRRSGRSEQPDTRCQRATGRALSSVGPPMNRPIDGENIVGTFSRKSQPEITGIRREARGRPRPVARQDAPRTMGLAHHGRHRYHDHMSDRLDPLVLDLVEWVAKEPRPYAQVLEAWRTSCPRLTVWEDASDRG